MLLPFLNHSCFLNHAFRSGLSTRNTNASYRWNLVFSSGHITKKGEQITWTLVICSIQLDISPNHHCSQYSIWKVISEVWISLVLLHLGNPTCALCLQHLSVQTNYISGARGPHGASWRTQLSLFTPGMSPDLTDSAHPLLSTCCMPGLALANYFLYMSPLVLTTQGSRCSSEKQRRNM